MEQKNDYTAADNLIHVNGSYRIGSFAREKEKAQRGAISYSLCLYLFYAKDIDAKCLIARKE
jgi:hypothetical protein